MTGKTNVGGAALNFRVVGGTTVPQNASENTIWIKTDQTIGSVTIDRQQPETPSDGDVFITIRNNSTVKLQLIRTKNIFVYPAHVDQYDASTSQWLSREAYIFRSGEWTPFALYLFRSGDGEEAVTTGWIQLNGTQDSDYAPLGYITISTNGIVIHAGNAQKTSAITEALIDFSSYTRLIVTVSSKGGTGGSGAKLAIVSSNTNTWTPTSSTLASMSLNIGENVLNVESLTSGYVQLRCWQSTDYTVTSVKLE